MSPSPLRSSTTVLCHLCLSSQLSLTACQFGVLCLRAKCLLSVSIVHSCCFVLLLCLYHNLVHLVFVKQVNPYALFYLKTLFNFIQSTENYRITFFSYNCKIFLLYHSFLLLDIWIVLVSWLQCLALCAGGQPSVNGAETGAVRIQKIKRHKRKGGGQGAHRLCLPRALTVLQVSNLQHL